MFRKLMSKWRLLIIFFVFVFCCLFTNFLSASDSTFIPLYQSFNFKEGKMVIDAEKDGDIIIKPYGIETCTLRSFLAPVKRAFIDDVTEVPPDESGEWANFADFEIDMVYAVKRRDGTHALFELVDVKTSSAGEVLGVEIKFEYQGSR